MKKIFNFILLIVAIFLILSPLKVRAGIICNDGWESSCSVEAPGCCSHHGGYGESDEDNYNGGSYSSGNNYSNDDNDGAIGGVLVIGGIIVFIILGIVGNSLDKPKTPEQKKRINNKRLYKFIKETNQRWLDYNNKEIEKLKSIKELKEKEQKVISKLKRDLIIYTNKVNNWNIDYISSASVYFERVNIMEDLCDLCKINEMLSDLDKRRKSFDYNDYLADLIEEYKILENVIESLKDKS